MSLSVSIDHRLGDFRLHAEFSCEGRLTALFGPSGSGKTSVINAIAGLLQPERARIVIDGETLTDTSAGVFVPTHRRHIGYVFQEARLFPHMSVWQNLLYAQRFGGRRASPGAPFQAVVDMLGVGSLLRRYPSHLSGGEKQRVAIGRALLSHPRLLLMDEPLASLDDARKEEILPYIERLRDEANVPVIYVSHSMAEVRRLADFVVMMDHGGVVGADQPQRAFAAVHEPTGGPGHQMRDPLAAEVHADESSDVRTPAGARDVAIALKDPGPVSGFHVHHGAIQSIRADGDQCRIVVQVAEATFATIATAAFVRNTALREGAMVYLLAREI